MSREQTLPDLGMIHGRLICSAWDYGLDEVQDDAARMVMQAVEVKSVKQAVEVRIVNIMQALEIKIALKAVEVKIVK